MVRMPTSELTLGMRVVELDRPWLGTPFLFQGFTITTAEELAQLRALCRYVYVRADSIEAAAPAAGARSAAPPPAARPESVLSESTLQAAQAEYAAATEYVRATLDAARLGEGPDPEAARAVVASLLGQVLRDPTALLWLSQIRARHDYTAQHCVNVAVLALALGRSAGLSESELQLLGLGALLHDVGKLRVPLEILNKPARLTAREFAEIRLHPEKGIELLNARGQLPAPVLEVVLHHHERANGQGYPARLAGERIPLFARLVAIVDVYDALTSDRAYHDAQCPHVVLKRMNAWAPELLDRELLARFLRTLGLYPTGTLVQMTSGEIGVVVGNDGARKSMPLILLLLDAQQRPYPRAKHLNLASPMWRSAAAPAIARVLPPGSHGLRAGDVAKMELRRAGAGA